MSRYPTPPQVERIGITETLQAPGIIPTEFRGNPLAGQLLAALGIAGDLAGQIGQNRRQNERDARMAENERRREDADLRRDHNTELRDQRTYAANEKAAVRAEQQVLRGAGSEAGKRQAKIDAADVETGKIQIGDPVTDIWTRAEKHFSGGDPDYQRAATEAYFDGMLPPALAQRTKALADNKEIVIGHIVHNLVNDPDPARFDKAVEAAYVMRLTDPEKNAMFGEAAILAASQPGGGEKANSLLEMMSAPNGQTTSKVGALLITTANAEKTKKLNTGNDRLATMVLARVPHKDLEKEAIDLVAKGLVSPEHASSAITKSLTNAQGELSGLLNQAVNNGTMNEYEVADYAARYISPSENDPTYVPGETIRALENSARTRRLKDVEENWKQNIDAQMGPADLASYEAGAGSVAIRDVTLMGPNGKEYTYTRKSRIEAAMAAYAIKAENDEIERAKNAKGGPQSPNYDNVFLQVAAAAAKNGAPLTAVQDTMKMGARSGSIPLLVNDDGVPKVTTQGYHFYRLLKNTMSPYLDTITDEETKKFYELVSTIREIPDFNTDEDAIRAAATRINEPPPFISMNPGTREDIRQQIAAKVKGVEDIGSIAADVDRYMKVYMLGGMLQEKATTEAVKLATLNVKVVNGVPIKVNDLHLSPLASEQFVPVAQSIFAEYVKTVKDSDMTPANMAIRRHGDVYILTNKETGYPVPTFNEKQIGLVYINAKTLNERATKLEDDKQAEAIQEVLNKDALGPRFINDFKNNLEDILKRFRVTQ